jgi:prepilin-type N-terminal cleavage/methylation domain-containing protein
MISLRRSTTTGSSARAGVRLHTRRGFTLVETLIATALLGFSLIVMFGFHSQAVRSNLHARKITDCTYLAQLQIERLIALPWTDASRPAQLTDLGGDGSGSDSWVDLPHPSGGPDAVNAAHSTDTHEGQATYFVSWDIEEMDSDATWVRLRVRCKYEDKAFNVWKGTTISSYRFRDPT